VAADRRGPSPRARACAHRPGRFPHDRVGRPRRGLDRRGDPGRRRRQPLRRSGPRLHGDGWAAHLLVAVRGAAVGGRGRVPGGGVVMERLPVRLIGLAVVVLVVGGCPAPELFDPLDEVVPLIGLELEVTVMDDGTTRTLEFRGNGFGYYQLNGSTYIRYLDVGDVTIAGSTALR